MGLTLSGEYGHAWTAPAGAGYGAMATVAGVRTPLGERRKTYDDEVLLSRVGTGTSPGELGERERAGTSGGGGPGCQVEEDQLHPVILKNRASSGELGLLFDQAIRNAEIQVEGVADSGIATGRSTSSPPHHEPQDARPPLQGLDPSSSGSSLALPHSNQSSESFRNGATPDTSLAGSMIEHPPSEAYGFTNQQSFYPTPSYPNRLSPPFGYPQRSNSETSESPYPYYQRPFGLPDQYPHPSHDPNIFALDPSGSPYSQLTSPHSQLTSLPSGQSMHSPPPSEHFYPPHPYGRSPAFSDQVPQSPSQSQYYASPPPLHPSYPSPHLLPPHRANQLPPSQPSGLEEQHYGVDPSQDSHLKYEQQAAGGPAIGGQVYGSDGSPATSPLPQQAYPPSQFHGPPQPPIFQQPGPYSSNSGIYPPQGAYPPYLPPHYPYPPTNYPSFAPAGPPFAYPTESPYVPYPYQQLFPTASFRPVSFRPAPLQPSRFPPPSCPKPYTPPTELARGRLAQAKLRDAVLDRESPHPLAERRRSTSGARSALPKPPPHSPHALWVGNVPSDASHAELWRFFASRPFPASSLTYAHVLVEGVDLRSTGVESIHLIARSNCAFVNYASDIHLQHSIAVSHGQSLRPFEPRCKELVCRVRKREDDTKSGVGAQRTGGMHRAYVARLEEVRPSERELEREKGPSEVRSWSDASTSSSFLGRHFLKRFFILKAMSEDDLKLSVERGVWVTQSHNEPVLDQAFRTCREGVFLIFGANKTGEFYGYAKMTGAISHSSSDSPSSHNSRSTLSHTTSSTDPLSVRTQTIPEDEPTTFTSPLPRPPLFSPSEHRLADASPLPLTPSAFPRSTDRPLLVPALLTRARSAQLAEPAWTVAAHLHLPEQRKGVSLDSKVGRGDKAVLEQQVVGASEVDPVVDEDGVWRKDTLPTAEERNARLDKMEEAIEKEGKERRGEGWGKPFKVEWVKVSRLPFSRTRHIKNVFNSNKEVKISRDGTELEPAAGELLIEEFWRGEEGLSTKPVVDAPPPQQAVPSGLVES